MTKTLWDQRYDQADWVYGTQPNEFITQTIKDLTPGRVLFPAE